MLQITKLSWMSRMGRVAAVFAISALCLALGAGRVAALGPVLSSEEGSTISVNLVSLDFMWDSGTLRVSWVADQEEGVAGYDVLASAPAGDERVRITQEPIPVHGDGGLSEGPAGYYYQVDIPTVEIGADFYLRALGTDGSHLDIGPCQAIYSGVVEPPVVSDPPALSELPKNMAPVDPADRVEHPSRPLQGVVDPAPEPVQAPPREIVRQESRPDPAPIVARPAGASLTRMDASAGR